MRATTTGGQGEMTTAWRAARLFFRSFFAPGAARGGAALVALCVLAFAPATSGHAQDGRQQQKEETRSSPREATAAGWKERFSFAERSDGRGYVLRVKEALRGEDTSADDFLYRRPEVKKGGEGDGTGRHISFTVRGRNAKDRLLFATDRTPLPFGNLSAHNMSGGRVEFRVGLRSGGGGRELRKVAAYPDAASTDLLLNIEYGRKEKSSSRRSPSQKESSSGRAEEREARLRRREKRNERLFEKYRGDADAGAGTVSASSSAGGAAGRKKDVGTIRVAEEPRVSSGKQEQLTVYLDAGHGGRDPGARAFGIQEKEVALSLARRVGSKLKEIAPGAVEVRYTRTADRFIPLKRRGKIANRRGGDLFVSIHTNASRDASASGTETYILGPHRTESALEVMKRENKTSKSGSPFRGEPARGALQKLTQSGNMRVSEDFASTVQSELKGLPTPSRGVKQAGFVVLWSATMPSVLIETGFLTNRDEGARLASREGQAKIAAAIARAIAKYATRQRS